MDDAGIRRSLSSIKDSFREVRQSARTNLNNIKFNDRDAKGYKKSMDELSNTFDQQQNNVNDLKSRYDELAAAGKENTQEGQRLRNEYNKQVDELNRLGHQLEQAKQGYFDLRVESNTFSKVGKNITGVSEQFKSLGTRLSDVGGALTRKVTLPAVGAATAVGGIVASFGWGRLVGLDSAQAQLKGLGYNTEEVGRISDQVTSAIEGGMTTMAEGTAVAAGAMAAGVEEGAELERYIKLVGDAAVGSNRPVEEMAQIFNRVQGSGKLMTQELNMIEQGMPGFAAAMAENLGVPQDEFREMVTAGEISSEEFMDVMDDFAGGMAEAYAESWEGMAANTKAYIGILGENLLGGVFEESKESIAELIELLSSEEAQEWAAEIGETIGKAFGSIIETIKDAVKWFTSLDDSQQKLIGKLALVAVAAGPVLSIFGTMTTIFGNILGPIGSLFTNFGRLSEAIGDAGGFTQLFKGDMESLGMAFPGLTSVLGTVKGAFGKVAGAITGISAPVAITVGAVVALGAGFVIAYKKSETFRNFISSIGDMLSGALQSIVDFKDNVVTAFEAVFSIFKGDRMGGAELLQSIGLSDETIQTIISYVSVIRRKFFEMRDKIQEALSAVGDFFRKIFDGIGEWWTNNGETILGYVTAGFEWMQETIGLVLDLVAAIWNRTWSIIKGTIEILWPIVSGIISDGINKIVDLFNFFAPIVTEIWNTLWPILQAVVEGVWERIKLVIGTTMDIIQGVIKVATALINGDWSAAWSAVQETIANVKARVVEYISNMKDITVNLVKTLVNNVVSWFNELWSKVTHKVSQLKTNVTETFTNIKNAVTDRIREMVNAVIRWFLDLFNNVRDRVNSIKTTTVRVFTDMKNNVLNRVKSLYTGVTDHFKNTYNSIKTWMTNAKDSAVGLAIDMKDQVIQKAKDILDYFKKLPGRLGNAISNGSNAFKGGFAKMLNAGISSVESGVNSIIKGINWVLDKLGASKIDTWSAGRVAVPAYAKGTDGHPEDGPAIVGDGGMKELIAYPNGQIGMSPDTDTLVNMPKGTQVMSGPDTKSFMNSMGIPKYKSGIGKAWDTVKNITGDFWNWASSGAKGLLDKSLGFLGISAPSSSDGPGIFGDVAKGAFGTIKDGAIGFIQDKIDDLFSFGGVNFPGFTKTSGFGPRNSPGGIGSTNHMGVDFAAPAGTPIPAQAGGQVTKSGWFGGLGNMVETTSGNTKYRYGHNSKNLVSIGDSVSPGQKIALVGSTGNSTGPHVHFEVIHNGKHVDPMTFGGGDAPAAGGGSGVGKWRNTAMQALRMTNQFTPANLNALMNQMSTESGGNPRAQNNWDINARRGTPSKGLMQVIDPTFQAFKMPGFNNIWNPMDNILASIRYATSRYGSLTNAYRGIGYADGGIVSTPGVYALAENGYPEFVIPTEPSKRGNAMKLLALAAKRLQKGNTQVSYSSGGSSEAVLGADMSETNNLLKTLIELIAQGQTLVADDKVMAEVLFGQIEKTMNKNYSRENIMRIKRGE